jgi:uncharacterized protein (TIGR02757 family)
MIDVHQFSEVKALLEQKTAQFNSLDFIETDPIFIPHQFKRKEDIEIAALFSATIAWGQRKSIIENGIKLMQWMDWQPYQFITCHSKKEQKPFEKFVHRTFNGQDCIFFLEALKHIYLHKGGLEKCFASSTKTVYDGLVNFRQSFFDIENVNVHAKKHVSDVLSGSAAKRLNMFLRWMVRKDAAKVDFGIWQVIQPKDLMLPLDVHTGKNARKLELLTRNQNDWKAVQEISDHLRLFDPNDPIKYDFALFGLGAFDKWE